MVNFFFFSFSCPAMLLPISASITYAAYEYDLGYGNKLSRVNLEAHKILNQERYKYFGKF
jgi:hypothetical protein